MAVRFSADAQDYTGTATAVNPPLTIACWGLLAVDRNDFSTFFCLDSGANTNSLIVQSRADGTTLHGYSDPGAVDLTGPAMTVGTWYKLAVVVDAASLATLYVAANGSALTAVDTATITATGFTTIRIGESVWNAEWLNGRVANVKMWSAALTLDEIETDLASWTAARTSGLVRHHKFQTAETTDYSGLGNTLSGGSGATTEADPPIGGTVQPTFVLDRGSVANVTAATTSSASLTSPTTIAVGNYLIARVAVDNSGTNGAAPGCTVTDPRSNTWTVLGPALVDPGAAAAGATAYLCYTRVVTAYQAADALTFNWGGISTTAKAIVVEEWTNIHSTSPVAVSAVTANAAASTAVSVAITPTAPNQLVYTCLATEGPAGDSITYDADTTNGTWATLTRVASASGTAASNQCVAGQYKVVTTAGAQSWDSTITSRDWAAVAVVFAPPPFPPPISLISREAITRSHYW